MRNFARFQLIVLSCFILPLIAHAQKPLVERIDPPHWWVNMNHPDIELLIKGKNLTTEVRVEGNGVSLVKAEQPVNKNYLRVTLRISQSAQPQKLTLLIGAKGKQAKVHFDLLPRNYGNKTLMGLNPKDFIYLITPDRFANGITSNDVVKTMHENTVERTEPYKRHGGDIAGIQQHLDYIGNLGATALWISPLLENNQPKESYHGYAITDHYKIDPRFGSNEDFRNLVNTMHSKGMKMIMDVVYNHWGDRHYLYADLPEPDMIHTWDAYTRTNYRSSALHDPHASKHDKNLMTDGWFDTHMPDLNQKNELVSNYLIQNSIWWIEEFGIDAFRMDTYAYADQEFMSILSQRIREEYPSFFLFGETWVHVIQEQNFFIEKNKNRLPFDSRLQSVTDFQWHFAVAQAVHEKNDWATGIARLYYVLTGDYLYSRPDWLVTFLDNHDLARWYGHCGGDLNKFKVGIALLFTSRGIPQLYYGTEILMRETDGHGKIRQDFPGGWPGDPTNKFSPEGRTEMENEAFDYISKLANYRKSSEALTLGALTHFVPENGVYVYVRHAKNGEKVLVMVNTGAASVAIDLQRFAELVPASARVKDIQTDMIFNLPAALELAPMSALVLEVLR